MQGSKEVEEGGETGDNEPREGKEIGSGESGKVE